MKALYLLHVKSTENLPRDFGEALMNFAHVFLGECGIKDAEITACMELPTPVREMTPEPDRADH